MPICKKNGPIRHVTKSLEGEKPVQILIADDEHVHLFLLEMFLRKWGYDVVSADNGVEAWQILQQKAAPRLAILDWELPGMQGVEICREVRRAEKQPYIYILMLTARAQKIDIQKGREAGADDYMTKPFEPEELRVRLLAGCRILESKASPVFSCPNEAEHLLRKPASRMPVPSE